MFSHPDALAHAVDAGLAAAGFRMVQGGIIQRKHVGAIAGMPAHAELSVIVPVHATPAGYVLTVEVRTPAAARWIAGSRVPLLLRGGLSPVEDPPHGELLRAHDASWARRFVEHPPTREALRAVLSEATFVEHRPSGELRMQLQRHGRTDLPDLARLLRAFEAVVATAAAPPAPAPAPARWTDNRALVMVLITVVVLGLFAALFVVLATALPY